MTRITDQIGSDVPARGATAQSRMVSAYRALFSGHGGKDDADIVLTDLAKKSGFFGVMSASVLADVRNPAMAMALQEGSRTLFKDILNYLELPPEALSDLQQAVKAETAIDNVHGGEIL